MSCRQKKIAPSMKRSYILKTGFSLFLLFLRYRVPYPVQKSYLAILNDIPRYRYKLWNASNFNIENISGTHSACLNHWFPKMALMMVWQHSICLFRSVYVFTLCSIFLLICSFPGSFVSVWDIFMTSGIYFNAQYHACLWFCIVLAAATHYRRP